MNKPIPSLAVDTPVAEYAEVFGIDGKRIPDVSNEIAATLLANNFRLRSGARPRLGMARIPGPQ